jgi:hypothetical protein
MVLAEVFGTGDLRAHFNVEIGPAGSLMQNLKIGLAVTIVPIGRSYVLRRVLTLSASTAAHEALCVRSARTITAGHEPGGIGHGEGSTARSLPKADA